MGSGDKVFEQVAKHFGVNRLFAGVWCVFGRSPIVLVEYGEQAGRIRIGAEIVGVCEMQQVVVLVAREQGAVEEARIRERLLDARVVVRYAVRGRLVEPFVEQECENGVVVIAGRFALCESFVEGFGRQFAVFVEYPHENDANEMAQHGFAVGVALVGAAGCLALLAQRPAVGELLEELFADGLGGDGVRQRIGSDGGGLVELIVDALYGSQGFGRGHMRVELGGHAGMRLVVNCDAGGGGFAGFVRLDNKRHGHFERHDFGESFGGERYVFAVNGHVVFHHGRLGANHRYAERFVGSVGLLGANLGGLGECVLTPSVDFRLRRTGNSYISVSDFSLDLGLARPRFISEHIQYHGGGCVFGNRLADFARLLGWIAPPRGGGMGGRRLGEHALDFGEIFGALALIAVEQAPFLYKIGLVVVVFAATDGVPYIAVGQKAVGAWAACGMSDNVAHQLALGSARMGAASAVHVGVERLCLQDGDGAPLSRKGGWDVVQHNIRAIVPRLKFAPLMAAWEPQEIQRGIYEISDGVLFAVVAKRD